MKYLIPERAGYTFSGWYAVHTKITDGTFKLTEDTTLVAEWNLVQYTVSYTLNGGTNAGSNPASYNYHDTFALADPEKAGYTFLGWTFEGQTAPTKNVSVVVGTTGDKAYTANWQANTYTVTFDANGGTASTTSKDVTFDTNLTMPTPERTGYTFAGWFVGSKQYTTGTWKTDSDVTLVAKWTANSYKATYNANGGSVSSSNKNYTYDANYTLLEPTRTGYEFLGWYKDGTLVPSTGTWKFDTNISLVAEWKARVYTVTYDAGVGTSSQSSAQATYDSNFTLATAERVGYKFDGWYYNGTKYSSGTWKTDKSITLTAKWTPRTDIAYVVNHHQQNANDDNYTIVDTEKLKGTADATIKPSVKTFTHFISPSVKTVTIAPDGKLVVDYYYNRVTYDLTYVTNGGDTIEKQTYKYNQTLVISTPSRTGYTFGGWFTNKELTTSYSATATLNADTTIYAYWSEENKPGDFTYSGTSGITVSAYNGTSTTMWIPAYIGNVPVTTIPNYAFKLQPDLLKVVVPETVSSLGYGVFAGSTNIEDLTIPFIPYYTLENIFEGTSSQIQSNPHVPTSLRKVTITCQTEIPTAAFRYCKSIEEINIPENVTSIGYYAFDGCSALLRLNSTIDGVVNIPEGVTEIKNDTFFKCLLVERINLGNAVTLIGPYAFSGCTMLTEFTIPQTVTEIGNYAFSGCISLAKINSTIDGELIIPQSVTSIGNSAFTALANITKIYVPESVESIGYGVFAGCTSLEDLTIPFIPYYTLENIFEGTSSQIQSNPHVPTSLRKVTITCQTEIPTAAFRYCKSIEEINIPENVTSIGYYAFDGCSALLRLNSTIDGVVNIPEGVTEIKNDTFYKCLLIEKVFMGDYITNIANYAFSGCSSLKQINSTNTGELVLPASVRSIGLYSFGGLSLITKIVIPDSVSEISYNAFSGCNGIEEVVIPFVGTKIGETNSDYKIFSAIFSAGSDIPKSISKVTITSQSVIPDNAFKNCKNIKTIILPSNATLAGSNCFYNCTATVSYTYSSTTSIWSGTDVSTSLLGNGSSTNPYQINSAADLAYLASSVNAGEKYEGKYFVLNINITLNSKSWTPIGSKNKPFAGTFDGNGKKVYNLSVTTDTAYAGLFGYVSGTIKNLGIVSGSIAPASTAGSTYAAPLVGYLTGSVENCYSNAEVKVSITNLIYAGGLIGQVDANATVKDSYASGHVSGISSSGFAYVGGFVASNKGTIEGCLAFGNVTAKGSNETYSRNGGFVANNSGALTECYRSESQILTKYTTVGNAHCNDGVVKSDADMISYAKSNWNSSIWEYELKYPNHK